MKWKIGKPFGVDVYIHWTFWLLPAWILLTGSLAGLNGVVTSILFVFAVFGCVVLHELGHALMARYFDIETRDITLYPIGGMARLERIPRSPVQELAIAIAGPAVNVGIAGVLLGILILLGVGTQGLIFNLAGGSFLVNLLAANIVLVVFNLLPAFPMDGGRVLRAILAMVLPYGRATEIAARVGQVIAVLFALLGVFTSGSLMLVALFVFLAAQAEIANVRAYQRRQILPPIGAEPTWYQSPHAPSNGIVWLGDVHTNPNVR